MQTVLEGHVALVIGGSSPKGRALAILLAEAGADVAVATLTRDKKEEVLANSCANEVWAIGRRGFAAVIDANEPAEVEALKQRVIQEFGRLDIVVEALPDSAH
ncbi:MAG TPA: SDR family NAD(P)-dependent oxidoreductase [Dehalococcoidia bacterium]|nr:SDR family NAD(P)-dependent oxidoreductase [Dehalococcoidia bacterium]